MKKKYSSLRIASILLMLVLITSCVVSGTFAKYTTSGSSSDSARVAKWGVVVNATGDKVVYDTIPGSGGVDTEELDIISSSEVKKIAPGTKGTFCTFKLTGAPEVAISIDYEVTVELEGWEVDGLFYCPLVIKVNGFEVTGYSSADEYESAIIDKIEELGDAKLTPGQAIDGTYNIVATWEWAYETDEAISLKDTALATKATRPTIKIDVTCTVTQID